MLSPEDAEKIRKLKNDLDKAKAEFDRANRATEGAKGMVKQVRASIRTASRTHFTSWLTNSDPEEYRRYRQAKAEHRDQTELARGLKLRIAATDERITAAVEECLQRSNPEYQRLVARERAATNDHRSCEEARTVAAEAHRHVQAALAQVQQLGGQNTGETREAMNRIATEMADVMSTARKRLTALVSPLRTYDAYPTKQIQRLRTEFSGRRADFPVLNKELTAARDGLSTLGRSLASASKRIAEARHGSEKKRLALVRQAREEVIGS